MMFRGCVINQEYMLEVACATGVRTQPADLIKTKMSVC